MKSMRENVTDLVDVGRSMECIADGLKSVRAIAVVNDKFAMAHIRAMRLAAQKMAKALGNIEYRLKENETEETA